MPKPPTGNPRGRPKGSGHLGAQMRLTVRIPQELYTRLEAFAEGRAYTRGIPQLAICVREALELYLTPRDKRQIENTPHAHHENKRQIENRIPDAADIKRQTINVQEPMPQAYDTTKFTLGPLCKQGHDADGQGHSLRYRKGDKDCVQCRQARSARNAAQASQRRAQRMQATREAAAEKTTL
jgi:hypothetical protein